MGESGLRKMKKASFASFLTAYIVTLLQFYSTPGTSNTFQLLGIFYEYPAAVACLLITVIAACFVLLADFKSERKVLSYTCYFLLAFFPALIRIDLFGTLTPPDMFGYAGSVNTIISSGHINAALVPPNVSQWPFSYNLWAIFTIINGSSTLEANGALLLVIVGIMALSFVTIARTVSREYAPYIAMLAFALSLNQYYSWGFFVDTTYAGALTFLVLGVIFTYALHLTSRSIIVVLLLVTAVDYGHPLWAVQIVGFVFLTWIFLRSRTKSVFNKLLIFSVVLLIFETLTTSIATFLRPYFNLTPSAFLKGLAILISGQYSFSGFALASVESKIIERYLFLYSDAIIACVVLFAVFGYLIFRKRFYKADPIILGWLYTIAIIGVFFLVSFQRDPGFLPRLPAQTLPIVAGIAGYVLVTSTRFRRILAFIGPFFLISLYLIAISANPIANVPAQKLYLESYYFSHGATGSIQLGTAMGPEATYFNPPRDALNYFSNDATIHGVYLSALQAVTVSTNVQIYANNGLYSIAES